jgi:hypothetical protein
MSLLFKFLLCSDASALAPLQPKQIMSPIIRIISVYFRKKWGYISFLIMSCSVLLRKSIKLYGIIEIKGVSPPKTIHLISDYITIMRIMSLLF